MKTLLLLSVLILTLAPIQTALADVTVGYGKDQDTTTFTLTEDQLVNAFKELFTHQCLGEPLRVVDPSQYTTKPRLYLTPADKLDINVGELNTSGDVRKAFTMSFDSQTRFSEREDPLRRGMYVDVHWHRDSLPDYSPFRMLPVASDQITHLAFVCLRTTGWTKIMIHGGAWFMHIENDNGVYTLSLNLHWPKQADDDDRQEYEQVRQFLNGFAGA